MHSGSPREQSGDALTPGEVERLTEWIDSQREGIRQDPDAEERRAWWTRVARTLDDEALGVLLTSKELNEERDALTGILNRRGLEWSLADILDWQDRTGEPVTVVLMDLDDFDAFNDAQGRAAADLVLAEWIGFLKDSVRKTDVLGRYRGEEVVAVLRGSSGDQGLKMFERMREDMAGALRKCLGSLGIAEPVTMSVGVVEHEPGEHPTELLEKVRDLTSKAKAAGRNLVVGGTA
ncbi:MAG: GGDEF domain-containing protein [Chloroflexi bacterium]|nr:GGDEF domain-containing protein [Chloroflexota bacterium]